jgi:polyhydroxyalkanoate synthesis regulator phasin
MFPMCLCVQKNRKMAELDYIRMASNKAKGARPYFFEDKAVERVLNITMAVAGEVAVVRERMDTIERLLAAKGLLTNAEIEAFVPTDEQAEERQQWQAEYISRILRIIQQEVETLQQAPENNLTMEKVADILSKS